MPRVYFDTNVYDHIDKGHVAHSDIDALRFALAHENLIANISIADVEELLGEWETNRTAAVRKLQIAREVVGFDEILKQPRDLLTEAIGTYGSGEVAPSPIMPLDQRNIVVNSLHRIIGGDTRLDSIMSKSLQEAQLMKEGFRQGMTQSRTEVCAEWERIVAKEGRNATFEEYWAAGATEFAEDLVPPDYVDACQARGFDGLLEVRTVRFAVGVLMSLIFSQIVGDGRQSRKPQIGDAYDLWHAVFASTADLFVTYDTRFAGLLRRVPIDNFRIFSSIPELLQSTRL
jgi:hypothetical protein